MGEKFSSLSQLEAKIVNYERKYYVDLYKRDSRTINSAIKKKCISGNKVPSDETKNKLKYYEIKYTCVHGGRSHKSTSSGKRKASTFKDDCPLSLLIRLLEDGTSLIVRNVNEEHNHAASEARFKFYPSQRRLSDDERSYAKKQLDMNINKKKLQHQLQSDTGKSVLLKDLTNIMTMAKQRDGATRNDLDACVDELRRVHNCEVDICTSQENDFYGLFAQDSKMKQTFSAFPEIFFLDATYKLLELQFPVYIFACEDSNGATHIVGLAALFTEDAPSVKWLIETFQKHNPNVSTTRLVMADKDINERDVIKELLPHVKVMICLFHSLKTFKREINVEDMGITIAEKNSCLEFISSMAYSKTEIEYNGVHQQFLDNAPASVKNYFENNWHPIREEWVIGYMSSSGNFLNRTNNRLESLNGKLKQVITKHSSLENFINEFFIILSVMRNERGYRAVYNMQKKKVQIYPPQSPEAAYVKLLTAYASGYVLHQLKIATNFQENYQWSNGASGEYNVQSSEGTLTVTTLKCSCCFFNSMMLPCRHIFSLRKKTGVSLFDRNLCANRWTNEYFEANSIAFNVADESGTTDLSEKDVNVDVLPATKRRKRNAHEKFSEVMTACKQLANTLSLCSENDFQRKLDQLKQLNNYWMENNEVGLQLIELPTSTSVNLSSTSITVSSDVDFSSSSTPPLVGTSTIDSSTNSDGHLTMAESDDDDDDDDDF